MPIALPSERDQSKGNATGRIAPRPVAAGAFRAASAHGRGGCRPEQIQLTRAAGA
jgi:hypothetical protein